MSEDVDIMLDLIRMLDLIAYSKSMYLCNRGPRPSGALLVLKENGDDGRFIKGNVGPIFEVGEGYALEEVPNCLDHGCMIEYHMAENTHTDLVSSRTSGDLIGIARALRDVRPHCVRNIHAEVETILLAARWGKSTMGATIYSINKPCYNCTQAILKAGISKIVYAWAAYDEPRTIKLLELSGIEVVQLELEEPEWS